MVIFPLVATVVSLIFGFLVLRQYIERRKPYQLAWSIALLMFGTASLIETVAVASGWTEMLARTWYLFGGALVVGYLALGSLYVADATVASRMFIIAVVIAFLGPVLPMVIFSKTAAQPEKIQAAALFGVASLILVLLTVFLKQRTATVWLWTMIVASAAGAWLVFSAPIDAALIAAEGWEAIDRSLVLKATVASINTLGSVIIVGGALYSALMLWRKQIMRERAIGNMLIGVGALLPAAGGFLTGYFKIAGPAALSISLAVGVTVMFIGFLQASRPSKPATG